jgi:hypothetical protein
LYKIGRTKFVFVIAVVYGNSVNVDVAYPIRPPVKKNSELPDEAPPSWNKIDMLALESLT